MNTNEEPQSSTHTMSARDEVTGWQSINKEVTEQSSDQACHELSRHHDHEYTYVNWTQRSAPEHQSRDERINEVSESTQQQNLEENTNFQSCMLTSHAIKSCQDPLIITLTASLKARTWMNLARCKLSNSCVVNCRLVHAFSIIKLDGYWLQMLDGHRKLANQWNKKL